MQTQLADFLRGTQTGNDIERILRSCVHCGFCNATCPTFSLLGHELDGPRGRIYQIKTFVETGTVTETVQNHLDRCLTCLSCTTTCPSGVEYNHLIDMGRELVEQRIDRPLPQSMLRWVLRKLLPYRRRFAFFLGVGRLCRPLLPASLRAKIPEKRAGMTHMPASHTRKMLMLDGCVQPALTPTTNEAAALVFDRLGIEVVRVAQAACCGAVSQHLMEPVEAQDHMRRNIDAWWPHVEAGAEAILVTASGCGVMVKDYAWHLRHDMLCRDKAKRISGLCVDPVEVLAREDIDALRVEDTRAIAFHAPCTLQHGQKLKGRVESLLKRVGFRLVEVRDAHQCCGSAGTYAILQPEISTQLRTLKLDSLEREQPDVIATANVGCQTHLDAGTQTPVVHWLELIAGYPATSP